MTHSRTLLAAALTMAFLASACAKKEENPIDRAVENTKDALDVRDNEKLKDAGESAADAVKDAGEGLKDAAKEASDKIKE
jgi:hypothetical protein